MIYFFKYKTIETHARAFLPLNISAVGSVPYMSLKYFKKVVGLTIFFYFFAVGGKELHSLTPLQLAGFRLHPGPLPEQYRYSMQVQTKRRRKHKKNRHKGSETPATDGNFFCKFLVFYELKQKGCLPDQTTNSKICFFEFFNDFLFFSK